MAGALNGGQGQMAVRPFCGQDIWQLQRLAVAKIIVGQNYYENTDLTA